GKSSEVLGRREPLRLEAPHLTRRSRAALRRFAADNPAHRRIVAQALGVVHILVSGKATKYRLPEQPGQCVPTILAGTCVAQNITISESRRLRRNSVRYPVNAGLGPICPIEIAREQPPPTFKKSLNPPRAVLDFCVQRKISTPRQSACHVETNNP